MNAPPINRIRWQSARRIISTRFPPIDLFEDLIEPEDWEAVARLEQRTNPRIVENIGRLDLVPVERRVAGPGASYIMGPFTHANEDSKGRFHDGTFGAYYVAAKFETAIAEKAHHQGLFFQSTSEAPGWFSQYRELIGSIDHRFHDIRGETRFDDVLDPDNWLAGQTLGRTLRANGSDGVIYPSVRHTGGVCLAAFWPDTVDIPVQGMSLSFHFDGTRIDLVRDETSRDVWRVAP